MRPISSLPAVLQQSLLLGGLLALAPPVAAQGRVSVGAAYACAVTSTGSVKCWGYGGSGQLGDGTSNNRSSPVTVSGITTAVSVAAGTDHTCAVLSDGAARCWGENANGQLGTGATSGRQYAPLSVTGLPAVARISLGLSHTCALTQAGGVWCWGYGGQGQLGQNSTLDSAAPVQVIASGAVDVSAADQHACAVLATGAVQCWGHNSSGQLGDGTTTGRLVPTDVAGLGASATRVTASRTHTCALVTGRVLTCWGNNDNGRLGDGTTTASLSPVTVSGLTTVLQPSAGLWHGCAVTTALTLHCWGQNANNWLGLGTNVPQRTTPVEVFTPVSVNYVSTHANHTCAATSAGEVLCWGLNSSGQLGDGTTTDRTTPASVPGLQLSTASPPTERPAAGRIAVVAAGGRAVAVRVATPGRVRLDVFDVAGRWVARLHDGWVDERVRVALPAALAAGVYVVRASDVAGAASGAVAIR